MDAEQAFRSLQKEECVGLYASQADLKAISNALKGDGREASFLPLWFSNDSIAALDAANADKSKQSVIEQEQRRVEAEQERLIAEEAKRAFAQQAETREAALRDRYRAQARGGQAELDQLVSAILEFPQPGSPAQTELGRDKFPLFAKWRDGVVADRWQIDGYSSQIAEFGMATWETRQIQSIAVQAKVSLVSPDRGKRTDACFVLGILKDAEFDRLRDPIESECGSADNVLDTWSVGHQLQSQWRVNRQQ